MAVQWTQPLWPSRQLLEQWTQPLEPGTVDTAFVAFLTAFGAVDTALGAWHGGHSLWTSAFGAVDTAFEAWHGGHSLWTSAVEQRTLPCGALRKWTSALRSGPGEDQVPYK